MIWLNRLMDKLGFSQVDLGIKPRTAEDFRDMKREIDEAYGIQRDDEEKII